MSSRASLLVLSGHEEPLSGSYGAREPSSLRGLWRMIFAEEEDATS